MQNQSFIIMRNFFQTIDTLSMKSKPTKSREKQTDLPEGYVSSDEFAILFEQKLLAAYEKA